MGNKAQQGDVMAPDWHETTPRVVSVDQIHPYEHNPRHSANPEQDRIKASIRAHGLDQPLMITQRPDTTDYIVHTGGNTRLLILKALHQETGEERFSRIPCLFKPWHSESDVLLAHLRENELRSDLTFIDRARAVLEAKALIETETGLKAISQRHLEKVLKARGYTVAHGLISKMAYAVGTLLPLLPVALGAGLGRLSVERIRRLERAAREIWKHRCLGEASAFDEVFAQLCRRYDAADWDIEPLRSAIEAEIAEQAEGSLHTIRVELEAQIAGRALVKPPVVEEPESKPVTRSQEQENAPPPASTPAKLLADPSDSTSLEPKSDSSAGEAVEEAPEWVDAPGPDRSLAGVDTPVVDQNPQPEEPPAPPDPPAEVCRVTESSGPGDLKSLRARAWALAARLAQRNGIGDLVLPLSGQGLGFILRDVPDSALADQLDDETLSQIALLWWHLAACAELTAAPLDAILGALPGESVLRRALAEQDAALLFQSVWTLDPGQNGHRFWRRLGDRDWQDLLHLMDTYRRIYRLAEETGTRLWEVP